MVLEINTSLYEKLPQSFYEREDVVQIARDLLGMILVTNIQDKLVAGRIVETEAYCGRGDKACHANNKRTPRTEVMYQRGGVAYVYLCYGIHHLMNVVTNKEGLADAVLIRGLEPVHGISHMMERRNYTHSRLSGGPGTLTQAMGITTSINGADLLGDHIWISSPREVIPFDTITSTRIGVDYAGDDALLPWRFYVEGNKFVSKLVKQ